MEIINRGGEKIAPREIDEALLSHPAISQAVAFPVPHSLLGETVAAAVVLKPGNRITEQALREFAGERLATFKIPEKILVVEEIPKGPLGEIQRIGLWARLGVSEIHAAAAPRTKTEERISAIFAETLHASRVGLRDNFFDLGGDSFLAAVLLTRIEASDGLEISFSQLTADPTVHGVCKLLHSPQPSSPAAWEQQELRVVVQPKRSRPALFCVPGASGNVAGFFHLARSLGLERPLTAFHLPSPDSGSYRLEKLAARYVREVLAAQPEGPYHLVGICTGGFVVYEMARQLSAQGKHIGVLALLDCYNHAWAARAGVLARSGYRLDLLRRRFLYQQKNLRRIGLAGVRPYLRSKLGDFFRTLMYRVRRLPIRDAADQYVPPVWPGSLVLFRVDEPRVDAFDYPDMGWRGLAQDGIVIHKIPGGHLTMLSEPNVDLVAERLLAVLEQAENSSVRSAGNGTG